MCFSPQRRAIFRHQNFKKCSKHDCQFLYILTSKCAFRHSGVQFFDIRTSKSAPILSFLTFWLQNVLFATAACNFSTSELQKVLPDCQFFTFWLQNVLFATAACNFSTSELQKVLPDCQFFTFSLPACAFRHSGVQFFDIRTSKSAPSTVMFCTFSLQNVLFATAACNFWFLLWAATSAPAALTGLLFDWPDTRIIEKTQHFATSLTFGADVSSFFWLSRYCIFFLLTWLLYSAFQLSILSEVSI